MKLVKPSFEIWTPVAQMKAAIILLENAGRTCYKSESPENFAVTKQFISNLIKRGHESVIEHFNVTVKLIVDRGVTHELVRHRLASYSQESTRYCNYSGGVTFIIPPWVDILPGEYDYDAPLLTADIPSIIWAKSMWEAEDSYTTLIKRGWTPQQARSVLPNSLKTEIITTANLREWRHIFNLRTSRAAHPQMKEIMVPLLKEFKTLVPAVFDDFSEE